MNWRGVQRVLGWILLVLAAAQLLPLAISLFEESQAARLGFAVGAALTGAAGLGCLVAVRQRGELYRREGVLIVVASWLLASVSGAIPYWASGAIPSLVDALFESASGFTTTGASILSDVEVLPASMLFWRSLSQWLGGIGIVVLLVALLSELGPGARFLFKLEVPGPKAEILHARVRETAIVLFRIYALLSIALLLALFAAGLDWFDAATLTFSTVSTGGFSPYNASAGHFSSGVQAIVVVFMLACGINFALYLSLVRTRGRQGLRDVEARTYLALIVLATAAIAWDRWPRAESSEGIVLDALFSVVSVLTTTGFATADFGHWPGLAQAVLVGLMVAGGCAGSTAGGAKVIRLLVGWKASLRDVRLTFSPRSVIAIAVGGSVMPEDSVRAVLSFLVLYMLCWGVGALLLAVGDTEPLTAATAAIACLSNVGPGLGAVGPTGNYAFFAPWQKLLMVGLMWLGRLELFVVLALAQRRFWSR